MSGFERFLRRTAALPAAFGCTHFHCNFINARSLRIREQLTEARRTLQRCAAPGDTKGEGYEGGHSYLLTSGVGSGKFRQCPGVHGHLRTIRSSTCSIAATAG
jgi:hypothetical protein